MGLVDDPRQQALELLFRAVGADFLFNLGQPDLS
jgi:hypothetical protein